MGACDDSCWFLLVPTLAALAAVTALVVGSWWVMWRLGRRIAPWMEREVGLPAYVTVGAPLMVFAAIVVELLRGRHADSALILAITGPAAALLLAGAARARRDTRRSAPAASAPHASSPS